MKDSVCISHVTLLYCDNGIVVEIEPRLVDEEVDKLLLKN